MKTSPQWICYSKREFLSRMYSKHFAKDSKIFYHLMGHLVSMPLQCVCVCVCVCVFQLCTCVVLHFCAQVCFCSYMSTLASVFTLTYVRAHMCMPMCVCLSPCVCSALVWGSICVRLTRWEPLPAGSPGGPKSSGRPEAWNPSRPGQMSLCSARLSLRRPHRPLKTLGADFGCQNVDQTLITSRTKISNKEYLF